MNQLFPRWANTLAIVSIAGVGLVVAGGALALTSATLSPWWTRVGSPIEQPVPFSHEHHVAGLGIDCRYCHTTVAKSRSAGIPPTETCMTCHSQVWTNAPVLQPVRDSWATGKPLQWNRVTSVPDFVYFNHSIHVNKGVACASCHGRIDQMPLTAKAETLYMLWCLDCHRHPAGNIVAPDAVTAMPPPRPDLALGQHWSRERGIETGRLDDCTVCHR